MEANSVITGQFITFEGGEGAGKSTLLAAVHDAILARGISAIVTREPGGTPLAESVRSIALNPPEGHTWSPLAQALLMNAARQDHLDRQIRPALRRGNWVLCDRFADSTRVYQGIDGVDASVLAQMERSVVGETQPGLTFILDAAPADLLARRAVRGTTDVFEQRGLDFHNRVREGFLTIAGSEPDRCCVLDALLSPATLLELALREIDRKFGAL